MSNTDNITDNSLSTTNAFMVVSNLTEFQLDQFATDKLGIIYTAHINENVGDINNVLSLAGGWSAKWLKGNTDLKLKLTTNDKEKRFLLNKGFIRYFKELGFSQFVAVGLLKARIKYKIELAPLLKTVINNNSFYQAYKSHPAYRDVYDRNETKLWFSRWGVVFDRTRPLVPFEQECELVRMLRVVEEAEEVFKKLPSKDLKTEVKKPHKSKPANKFLRNKNNKQERTFQHNGNKV